MKNKQWGSWIVGVGLGIGLTATDTVYAKGGVDVVANVSLGAGVVPFAKQIANVGADVKLKVQIVNLGSAQPKYTWKLNGEPIPGASGEVLQLRSVGPADGGLFSAAVKSGTATTEVVFPIEIAADLLPFADSFIGRGTVTGSSGYGIANNVTATRESGEPTHGRKGKGKSIWLSWRAPADGPVTFTTAGSAIDTVLAVYTGSAVNKLARVADDDDSSGYATSEVTFNAKKNATYAIAVDGVSAATVTSLNTAGMAGSVMVVWEQQTTGAVPKINTALLPQLIVANVGQAVQIPLPIAVAADTTVQWFRLVRNSNRLLSNSAAPFSIPRISAEDVGQYYFEARNPFGVSRSPLVDVQINTKGDSTVAAYAKLADSQLNAPAGTTAAVTLKSPSLKSPSVQTAGLGGRVRRLAGDPNPGYSGAQIFQNLPGKDIGEPDHCGELGGSSFWFAYNAPAAGRVNLDTIGSNFPTILSVYYDDGLGNGYASLVPVTCGVVNYDGFEASAVNFIPNLTKTYYIVVDGFDGLNGTAWLNYKLTQ
ncbi:MAG: immunoglobulin domain-containing protein [Verrucomicrobia bacterium]|nr:immunoglobulin domain-containing protein [Verrucomicrobiota bacterium]